MDAVVIIGKGTCNVIVDVKPSYVIVGVGSSGGGGRESPIVSVDYPLDLLTFLSPMLKELQRVNYMPQIFLWNLEAEEPEVCIIFSMSELPPEIVARLDPTHLLLQEALNISKIRLVSVSAANAAKEPARRFKDLFGKTRAVVVLINEAESGGDVARKHVYPFFTFVTNQIYFKPMPNVEHL